MSALRAPGVARSAPIVLAFDTAGSACSVAIGSGDAVLASERQAMRHGHAEVLLPMVDRVSRAAGITPREIGVVGVTVGPGGFTGIRAGLAAAHGLAQATGARLAGISSFTAVAASVAPADARLLVALDSRREDLYVQLFAANGTPLGEPAAILPRRLPDWVGDGAVVVAGDAADAAASALGGRARPRPDAAPDALGVLAALRRWPERADHRARPLYLRPPDVSLPKARA
jgi:tRNA threonylcarbamoyladenosine biosynthesis protein TsaB